MKFLRPLLLLLFVFTAYFASAAPPANPTDTEISMEITKAARAHRVPSLLVKGIAWQLSHWRQFDETGKAIETDGRVGILGVSLKNRKDAEKLSGDWKYNIEAGVRDLELCWNRAPIMGTGVLEDGRNIFEAWYFAVGRYSAGKQGDNANRFTDTIWQALATDNPGHWQAVPITSPKKERLNSGWLNYFGTPAPWHFADVTPRPAATPVISLEVPYFGQVLDVPDNFDGSGSCGPSSMLMILAYYQKVQPNPVQVTTPYLHISPYGNVLPEIDKKVCDPNLGAVHAWMLDYLRPMFPGVAIFYDEKATWELVKSELDAHRPVILGTQATPAGHLMVARGYLTDGRLLVNDPAGDREQAARRAGVGGWSPTGVRYWNRDGNKAVYDWDALQVRWVMTFGPKAANADKAEDEDMKKPEVGRDRFKK